MNTRRTLLVLLLLSLAGCKSIEYSATEVHRTITFPGFSDEIHATGVQKEGNIRRADTLTHSTSILGFSRTSTYKGAELEVLPTDPGE